MRVGSKGTGRYGAWQIWAIFCAPLALVFAASQWLGNVQANSCVGAPPVKISGAFCGRIIDAAGYLETDGELQVVDGNGSVIARTSANSKGDFKFPPLRKGSYRVMTTAKGFMPYVGQLEILSSNAATCRRPTTVVLGTESCVAGIGKDKPPHFHEPGW